MIQQLKWDIDDFAIQFLTYLQTEYDNLYCLSQMSQPKLQLELPTHLIFSHFLRPSQIKQLDGAQPSQNRGNKLLMRLKAAQPEGKSYYDYSFVMNFLLIKINSYLVHNSFPKTAFISTLIRFYNQINENSFLRFKSSRNDGELMTQILLQSRAYEWIDQNELDEVLEGNALIGATVVQALRQGQWLSKQCYFVIVLGLVSLHGRTKPYIPIVHQDKNHAGQISFAKRVDQLIHMNPKVQKVNLEIIQDAYSLRCTPQVHGVSLDMLSNLRNNLEGLVNRAQTKHVLVKGKRMRNLALRAQSETLLLDHLIMGLNELGHMSFLRSQRILNKHLGKNNVQSSQHYEYLRILLKKYSYLVGQNKILSISSSIDTILMQDYHHDIYVHEGTPHTRLSSVISNLKCLFKLQVMAALEVILSMYSKENSLFLNEEMEATYTELVNLRNPDSIEYGKAIQKWLKI